MRSEFEKKTYNKSTVFEKDGVAYLQSYDTVVCGHNLKTGEFYRFCDDFSRTTQRHIQMFCDKYGISRRVSLKKNWESLAVSHADVTPKTLKYKTVHHVNPFWGYIQYGYQRNLY